MRRAIVGGWSSSRAESALNLALARARLGQRAEPKAPSAGPSLGRLLGAGEE